MKDFVTGAVRRRFSLRRMPGAVPFALAAFLIFGGVPAASADDAKSDPLQSGPLFAVVSLADQHVSIYGSGGLLARSPVSTGKRGHSTPAGVFSIVQKRRYHRSNLYNDAPMPFMQRLTWSGIALHAGVVPGYPASHGCIRLPASFAKRLFRASSIGHRVIVAPSDTVPTNIIHANLPAPFLSPDPRIAAPGSSEAADEIVSVSTTEQNSADLFENVSLQDDNGAGERLNPIEFARAMSLKAKDDIKLAAQANRAAKRLVASKNTELRKAARKLASADDEVKDAERKLARAIRRFGDPDGKKVIAEAEEGLDEAKAALIEAVHIKGVHIAEANGALRSAKFALAELRKDAEDARITSAAGTGSRGDAETDALNAAVKVRKMAEAELLDLIETEERHVAGAVDEKIDAEAALAKAQQAEEQRLAKTSEAKSEAEAALAEAEKAAEAARIERDARKQELADARKAVDDAKAAGRAAMKAKAEAKRRLKPLSVFISRKTKRLYVRQDWKPLFDVPVKIRDADYAIGTHLYVGTDAAGNGSQLHWQAVSMPVRIPPPPVRRDSESLAKKEGDLSPEPVHLADSALNALDRVIIPPDVKRRLAELAWVGASVIISDHGISGETGSTTDFIVLTKSRRGY